MSLTTEITALTGQVSDLTSRVAGWVDDADARIAAAVRAIPDMGRRIYVSAGGDDAAAGTEAEPVATIAEAVRRTPDMGDLALWLLSDITIDEHIDAQRLGRLTIVSHTTRRTISFGTGYAEYWDGYRLDGLAVPVDTGLMNVAIQYPSATAAPPTDRPTEYQGLLQVDRGHIRLWNCSITGSAPSSPVERWVIDPRDFVDISITGFTSWQTDVASHLIRGVPAGGDPNALWNVRCNITQI